MATIPNTPGGPAAAPTSPRHHDLDALRATAMLLGIVLHAALFLVPEAWPVLDPKASSSLPYGDLVSAIHGFRMPLFFLLSGFFSAMLTERRGLRGLVRQRLLRVGLPLAVGCVTVVPLTLWVFLVASEGDTAALLAREYPPGTPDAVIAVTFVAFAWTSDLAHLWFLWHLLWLAGIYALLVRVGVTFASRWWWALVPLVAAPQFTMDWFGADTSSGLAIPPDILIYYALFFLFGAHVYASGMAVQRWWAAALAPGAALYPIAIALLRAAAAAYDGGDETTAGGYWALGSVAQTAFTWMACFGLMGLFRAVAAVERPWVRYLSDASYWLYLMHLPLVVVAQGIAAGWDGNVHIEFAVIVAGATLALLAVYHVGVRHTPVGTLLNGPRQRGGG